MNKLDLTVYLENSVGKELWSPCYGKVILTELKNEKIIITSVSNNKRHTLNLDGTHNSGGGGYCMLYGGEEFFEYLPDPKESWEAWKKYQSRISYRVTVLLEKIQGDNEDPNPGKYTVEFEDPLEVKNAVLQVRKVLDECKNKE